MNASPRTPKQEPKMETMESLVTNALKRRRELHSELDGQLLTHAHLIRLDQADHELDRYLLVAKLEELAQQYADVETKSLATLVSIVTPELAKWEARANKRRSITPPVVDNTKDSDRDSPDNDEEQGPDNPRKDKGKGPATPESDGQQHPDQDETDVESESDDSDTDSDKSPCDIGDTEAEPFQSQYANEHAVCLQHIVWKEYFEKLNPEAIRTRNQPVNYLNKLAEENLLYDLCDPQELEHKLLQFSRASRIFPDYDHLKQRPEEYRKAVLKTLRGDRYKFIASILRTLAYGVVGEKKKERKSDPTEYLTDALKDYVDGLADNFADKRRDEWRKETHDHLLAVAKRYQDSTETSNSEAKENRENGTLTAAEEERWMSLDDVTGVAVACFNELDKLTRWSFQFQMSLVFCLYALNPNVRSGWFNIKFRNFDTQTDNYLEENDDGSFSAVFRVLKTDRTRGICQAEPVVHRITGDLADIVRRYLAKPGSVSDRGFESDYLFRQNKKAIPFKNTTQFTRAFRDFLKTDSEFKMPLPALLRKIEITGSLGDKVKETISALKKEARLRGQSSLNMLLSYHKPGV